MHPEQLLVTNQIKLSGQLARAQYVPALLLQSLPPSAVACPLVRGRARQRRPEGRRGYECYKHLSQCLVSAGAAAVAPGSRPVETRVAVMPPARAQLLGRVSSFVHPQSSAGKATR